MPSRLNKLHLVGDTLFEWDPRKAAGNWKKHGISFEEAATVFSDDEAIILDDDEHSGEEERLLLLGISIGKRILTVVHVERGVRFRIISARPATRKEKNDYEKSVVGRQLRDES